jgi:putative SOS response-associated peptidase YedK
MRWGIVPRFSNSELEFKKLSTINAKSDRLTDSKMWREPFAKRRCLGSREWATVRSGLRQGSPLRFDRGRGAFRP